MLQITEWDKYFLKLAEEVAQKSKDPSTKVGAVLVRPDNSVCSIGYNGFPKYMVDSKITLDNRQKKLDRIIHAEMNALLFSRDQDHYNYSIYTWPFFSCHRCTIHLLQCGVSTYVSTDLEPSCWKESIIKSKDFIEGSLLRGCWKQINLKTTTITSNRYV